MAEKQTSCLVQPSHQENISPDTLQAGTNASATLTNFSEKS